MCENLEWEDAPTKPGWYWYTERKPIGIAPQVVASVVEIRRDPKMGEGWLLIEDYCGGVPINSDYVKSLDLLWMGPIQKPPVEEGYPILQAGYGLYFREEVTRGDGT